MVSKFKTVEKTAVDILLMFTMAFGVALAGGFSTLTHAEEKKDESSDSSGGLKISVDPDKACVAGKALRPNETPSDCYNRILGLAAGSSSKSGCEKEKEDLEKALEKADKSCGEAGITGKSDNRGFPSCAGAVDLCSCQESPGDPKCPAGAAEEIESERPLSDGGSGVDLNKERFNADYCPAISKADLKDFKEEVKESQKTVDELENEIPELQDAINSAESDLNAKLSDLEEQKKESQKEYNNSKKELERSKKDNIKALEEKISGIQDQIFKTEADIRTALLSKTEVQLKRDESVKAIKLSCHSVATQEASARRLETFKQIKAGTYVRGGFLSALKRVGLSDRKEDQQFAEKLYKNCLASKQTKEAIDSANKMAALSLNQIDGTILSLQKQVAQLNESITKVKNQEGGCGAKGPNGEDSSEMCRALTEFQEDRVQLDNEALQDATKIGNDIIRARTEASNAMATKQEALARKQEQLTREQQYLADKKEALALKLRANGASGASSEKVATALGDINSLEGIIRRIKTKGCCSVYNKEEGPKEKDGLCAEIDGYMSAFDGVDPATTEALGDNASDVTADSGATGPEIVNANKPATTDHRDGTKANPNAKVKSNSSLKTDKQTQGIRESNPTIKNPTDQPTNNSR